MGRVGILKQVWMKVQKILTIKAGSDGQVRLEQLMTKLLGLAILWEGRENARLLGFSRQLGEQPPWRLIEFYGLPNKSRRTETSNLRKTLADKYIISSLGFNWCI